MATLPDVDISEIPNHYAGDITELGDEFLQGKLHEVVDQINVRWGSLVEARIESGKLPLRLYSAVVVRVASRLFGNTEGFKRETEGGYSYELSAAVASGTLWYTDDDERDLTGRVAPKKKTNGAVGTVRTPLHRGGF